nr:hypothetical protein GCM10017745_38510 [Saccharothrix mutabilis subsp. capreolus]
MAREIPNTGGTSRQEHPETNTKATAANEARSSLGSVPPPCRRLGHSGNAGWTNCHTRHGTSISTRSCDTTGIVRRAPT